MKIRLISFISTALVIFLAGCAKDNFEPPKSQLSGKIHYQGAPLGVASNKVTLELWQHGYQLFTKVAIPVAQDGTYSALLFDGDYKLLTLKGNGPWADPADSINVKVSGNTVVDIPVSPYFIVKDITYTKTGTFPAQTVTATFSIQQINTTKTLQKAQIMLYKNILLDDKTNGKSVNKTTANMTNPLTTPQTLSADLPSGHTASYIYARVGVATSGVTELVYSDPIKIELK